MKKKPKNPFKKGYWAKGVTLDEAYNLGKSMGMRIILRILFDEMAFDKDFIAYLIEDYIIKKEDWKEEKV